MKNYHIQTIQFDEEIGIGAACQADNSLLQFVLQCVALTAAGQRGDVSEADAFRLSGIPSADHDETEDVISAWTLPEPVITTPTNFTTTFVFIWLKKRTGVVSFGLY